MDTLPSDPRPQTKPMLLQSPFVQNVLPFVTSLLLHLGVVVLGISVYQIAVTHMTRKQEQVVIPISDAAFDGEDNHVKFNGLGTDPDHRAEQMNFPQIKESEGISDQLGKSLLPGGSEAGDGGDVGQALLAMGAGGLPGQEGNGLGHGRGKGRGEGDEGLTAPWGPHFHGGEAMIGKIPIVDRRVVFICDATGSMMEQFDTLRRELRSAIEPMKPAQAANVVFVQENAPPPLVSDLELLSPQFKRKLLGYVDNATPRGRTDPMPALKTAFAMHPDRIFFLCDPGDFPDRQATIDLCRSLNAGRKTKITTIAFENHDVEGEKMLKQIAADSGGEFKFVRAADLGN